MAAGAAPGRFGCMSTATELLPGRLRAAWTAAHAPGTGVPRWARIAPYLVTAAVLPSCVWRIAAFTLHVPLVDGSLGSGDIPSGIPGVSLAVYMILLSVFSELVAFTAFGLVARWGEVFPRWIPALRGRPVPRLLATVPAALGSAALTLLWTWVTVSLSLGRRIDGRPRPADGLLTVHDWHGVVSIAAYAPLLLWGPLLAALTVAYWKRRPRRSRRYP